MGKRLSYDNLLILCGNHHELVDSDKSFTVSKLRKMKKDHEAKCKKPLEIPDNLLEKIIKSADRQYEPLFDEITTMKNDVKAIRDILSSAYLGKKQKKNVQTFTGKDFTISWPDSWTTNVPYISHKELVDKYFGKNTSLKFSNPVPVIQIRSKKKYFGIYPAAAAGVTILPEISLADFIEFVKDELKKIGYEILESYVDKMTDSAIIITSKKHYKTTSYFSQRLQIHKNHLYGFIISSLTDEQIKKAPNLVKELKQIAQSFAFTD